MNRTKLFILALAGIFAVSCATDNVDNTASTSVDAALLKKFVNTPEEAIKGELIIYVDDATAAIGINVNAMGNPNTYTGGATVAVAVAAL